MKWVKFDVLVGIDSRIGGEILSFWFLLTTDSRAGKPGLVWEVCVARLCELFSKPPQCFYSWYRRNIWRYNPSGTFQSKRGFEAPCHPSRIAAWRKCCQHLSCSRRGPRIGSRIHSPRFYIRSWDYWHFVCIFINFFVLNPSLSRMPPTESIVTYLCRDLYRDLHFLGIWSVGMLKA